MDLLERFSRGDVEAFESLFQQFQSLVYGWIVRVVRDPGVAEDLTVETFWRIHRAHARFDPARNFGAWARRIATNVAVDHLRAAHAEVALPDTVAAAAEPDPAVQSELRGRIAAAFHRLPAKLRIVATLVLVEEQTYQEVSDALGISLSATKLRVFRAVRRLRKNLKGQGITP